MRIHLLLTDGVFDLGLAALHDTLSMAQQLAPTVDPGITPLQVTLTAASPVVTTAQGLQVPVANLCGIEAADAVIVPALGFTEQAALEAALAGPHIAQLKAALVAAHGAGARIGAACTGTWLLADSGLLDGHAATTSWWLADAFRLRFPEVALDESRLLVASSSFLTAGAAMAHVDLALELVRCCSVRLAAQVGRYLLAAPRVSQAPFMWHDHPADRDAITHRFERWALSQLAHRFSLADAARSIGTSPRTLSRRVRQSTGMSPLALVQDLRTDRAVHLLRTTNQSVDQVAAKVGYAEGVTLRHLLKKKLGKGVRALRSPPSDA